MANNEHLAILMKGVVAWNTWRWREAHPDVQPDLSKADLRGVDLSGVDLSKANLSKADLRGVDLFRANLREANLFAIDLTDANLTDANVLGTDMSGANLNGADLWRATLTSARLFEADLSGANLALANLMGADLSRADLTDADLYDTNLTSARLFEADLSGANLNSANLTGADLTGATLIDCIIYGISVWDAKLENTTQQNLIITKRGEPIVTVDNLEVAQFIYLLLHNEKLRDVINTIGQKAVLILGRFTPERKKILDALRDKLREKGYLPIIFDFDKSEQRDFTETIKILAGMSLFVIADITNPKSSPLELQATVPDYMIPFAPIIQKGESPFAMFADLRKYPWLLPVRSYEDEAQLLAHLDEGIIKPALHKHNELLAEKNKALEIRGIDEL